MQEPLLYEYAIIRVVPRVEREEFVNAGVVLFCKTSDLLICRTALNEDRIRCIFTEADMAHIRMHVAAFEQTALGEGAAGTIAALETAARFRWLTAVRSTIIQCSKVHPGLSFYPENEAEKLLLHFVL